jgi:hypothetical protein
MNLPFNQTALMDAPMMSLAGPMRLRRRTTEQRRSVT